MCAMAVQDDQPHGETSSRVDLTVLWILVVLGVGGCFLFGLLGADAGVCGGDGGTARRSPGSVADQFCNTFVIWDRDVSPATRLTIVFAPLALAGIVGVVTQSRTLLKTVVCAGIVLDLVLLTGAIWL